MRILTANRRMTALACGLSLLTLACLVLQNRFADQRQALLLRQLDETRAAAELRSASDLLTASVRAYAATGDERHREAFQTELRQTRRRDSALETMRRAGDSREAVLIETAKRESDALLQLEQRIFELADKGQRAQALALAYGSEYERSKARIVAPVDAAIAEIAQRSANDIGRADERARWAQWLAIASVLLNGAAVLYMLLGYYKRRIVGPLTATSELLRRFGAGDRALQFRDPEAAFEVRELGELLQAHAGAVAELEQQRQALLVSDQEQRAIFNAASSGIVLIRKYRIVACNERLGQLLGRPVAELIGQPTAPLIAHAIDLAEFADVSAALESGQTYRAEVRMRRADGQTFWARLSGQQLDATLADRSVWVVDDISAEREAVEHMLQAQRIADDAARTKAAFLVDMGHEIRAPMNSIIGITHLLGRTALDPRQADYLRRIDVSSQHLQSLLNDVLDLSRIEAGRLAIDTVEFDLERTCQNAARSLAAEAAAKGLQLHVQIAPELPAAFVGDPLRLSQILLNYVGNAVKFTPSGEVAIVVGGQPQQADEWMLRFEVRDTGVGITDEQAARMFRNLEPADASAPRRFGGTGLGLSIARSLATLMGGEVGVESRLGVGSTFWFTARLSAVSGAAALAAAADADAARWPGRRVLLVDDDEASRIVSRELLEGFALTVDVAGDGAEAVERAGQQRYDLVLMDLHMPQMDGIEATHRIRQHPDLKRLPIVAMTANALSQDRQRSLLAGMDDHIAKPIELPTLKQKLQRWLASPVGAAATRPTSPPEPRP